MFYVYINIFLQKTIYLRRVLSYGYPVYVQYIYTEYDRSEYDQRDRK